MRRTHVTAGLCALVDDITVAVERLHGNGRAVAPSRQRRRAGPSLLGRWRTLAVMGSVMALPAAGCGGDSSAVRLTKADYQARILAVLEDASEPTRLYTDLVVGPRPRQQCAAGVATLKDQVGELVDRIAALRPPAPVQAAHDDFVEAARTSVDRIGTVREEVADGGISCGGELNQELYAMPSTKKAERAIARIERRGYFVFGE